MSRVVIVGAGPAGATLAYLLARNGVEVTLLERHTDFSREFRGEVLLPGGIRPFDEMGLWDAFEAVPQVQLPRVKIYIRRVLRIQREFTAEEFGRFGARWISQPGLLEMLVERAEEHAGFRLERGASVGGLLEEDGRWVGVRARIGGEERELRADLVVGCDGRTSVVRRRAGIEHSSDPTPMDIVWCKLPMLPAFETDAHLRFYAGDGHLLVAAPVYDGCLQLGWIIRKGSYGEIREQGMPACLDAMADHVSPDLAEHLRRHRADAIEPFLLSTVSDRVRQWAHPGLLVIGDAAHTMSPVGAQGLNVAIRDAVVAANHLVPVLAAGAEPAAIDAATRAAAAERLPEISLIQRIQAVPPRVLLNDSWWSRAVLSVVPALAATRLGEWGAQPGFRRFFEGVTDVHVAV